MNAAATVRAMQTAIPATTPVAQETSEPLRFKIRGLNFFYGEKQALYGIDLDVPTNRVTALIGPSGCGKSTFLRNLNRMQELIRHTRLEGEILLDGQNILELDVVNLRKRVGMVFQRPNPFPKSIFENVAYGLRINGYKGSLSRTGGEEPAPSGAVG